MEHFIYTLLYGVEIKENKVKYLNSLWSRVLKRGGGGGEEGGGGGGGGGGGSYN